MPATPADIAAGQRQYAVVTQQDTAIRAAYIGARDTGGRPLAAVLDNEADAQAVAAAVAGWWGVPRRRFQMSIQDFQLALVTSATTTPAVTYVDNDLSANGAFAVAVATLDLDLGVTYVELLG